MLLHDTLRHILSSHNIVLSTESDESFPREHAPFHSPPKYAPLFFISWPAHLLSLSGVSALLAPNQCLAESFSSAITLKCVATDKIIDPI